MSTNRNDFKIMPRYLMRKNALNKILSRENCSGKKLLEIGYGAGEIFSLYQKYHIKINGFDFSDLAYQYTKTHCQVEGIHLFHTKDEINHDYDYVVACEVLEHIKDDVAELKIWKSYLNSNGKLILSVPAHQKRWGYSDIYVGHYRRYERAELIKKLKSAGFKIEKIYTYDFPSCFFLDILRDISCGKKLKKQNSSKEDATKKSGIERDHNFLVRILSMQNLWYPVIKFQELFYKKDWGSAYILIASI